MQRSANYKVYVTGIFKYVHPASIVRPISIIKLKKEGLKTMKNNGEYMKKKITIQSLKTKISSFKIEQPTQSHKRSYLKV